MPGKASDSSIGRTIGLLAAVLAVGLLALGRFPTLSVPYDYDGGPFLLGLVVAAVAALDVAWRYVDAFPPR